MARYRTPDVLVCLGGAGTAIGRQYMEQNWLLREVMDPNPREKGPVESEPDMRRPIETYFVDTDVNIGSTITNRISDKVNEIAEDYDSPPEPQANYLNLVAETRDEYLSTDTLLADSFVNDLSKETGINAWWLDRGDGMLSPLGNNFSDGVVRRRGLTKALNVVSEYDNDPLSKIESGIGSNDRVAMIVGLGGGTGSGLLLDLGLRLSDHATVTLFAVLPRPSGQDDKAELANAYAALSEIEFLALNDSNPFRNIILLPFEPATDDESFGQAASYTINAYYNAEDNPENLFEKYDESQDNGPPKIAPFTLALPQVLHYLKEDIEATKENYEEFQEEKRTALAAERKLYDRLEEYIRHHHDYAVGELLESDEASMRRLSAEEALELQQARLDPLIELLGQDFMVELDFESAAKASSVIDDVRDQITKNTDVDEEETAAVARKMVTRLPQRLDISEFEPQDGWVKGEHEFAEMVMEELRMIGRRAGLVRAINRITEETGEDLAEDIDLAMDPSNKGHLTKVDEMVEAPQDERRELIEVIDELEVLVDGAYHAVEETTETWRNEVEDDLDLLCTLAQNEARIHELISELERAIEDRASLAEGATGADQIRVTPPDFDDYFKLNELLKEVGLDPVDQDAIEESVKAMLRARRKQHQADDRSSSVLEGVRQVAGMGSVGPLKDDYQNLRNQEMDRSILTISEFSEPFEYELQDGYFEARRQQITERRDEIVDEIVARLDEALETPADYEDEYEELLSKGDVEDVSVEALGAEARSEAADASANYERQRVIESLRAELDEIDGEQSSDAVIESIVQEVVEDAFAAGLAEPYEEALESKRDRKQELEKKIEMYHELDEVVGEEGRDFTTAMTSVRAVGDISEYEEPSDDHHDFVKDTKPDQRGRIGSSSDLGEADLWSDDKEKRHILKNLTNMADKILGDNDFLPLKTSKSIGSANFVQPFYNGTRTHAVYMSQMFDEYADDPAADIDSVGNVLTDRLPVDSSQHNAARGTFAAPWDVSMTFFMGGVFLDNLGIATDECREAYDAMKHSPREASINPIVVRHTYGVDGAPIHQDAEDFIPEGDDGAFCFRKDTINPTLDDDLAVLLDQATEERENYRRAAESLISDYYEVVGFESTRDISR